MMAGTVILFWRLLAILFLALGLVGVVLPVMPTVPFLLGAAWAAGRGWPAVEQWLLAHAAYGPVIVRWRERRAVPRRAKWFASIGMACSGLLVALLPVPLWLKVAVPLTMVCVGVWLWSRPDE